MIARGIRARRREAILSSRGWQRAAEVTGSLAFIVAMGAVPVIAGWL